MAKISSIVYWLVSGLLAGEALFADIGWQTRLWLIILALLEFGIGIANDRQPRELAITDHWARGRGLTVKLKNGVVLDLTEVPDGQK